MGLVDYSVQLDVMKKLSFADQKIIRWMHESPFYLACNDSLNAMDDNNFDSAALAYFQCGLLLAAYDEKGSNYYIDYAYRLVEDEQLKKQIEFAKNIKENALFIELTNILSSMEKTGYMSLHKLAHKSSNELIALADRILNEEYCEIYLSFYHNLVFDIYSIDKLKYLDSILPSNSILKKVIIYTIQEFIYLIDNSYIWSYDTNAEKNCEALDKFYNMAKYYNMPNSDVFMHLKAAALYDDEKYSDSLNIYDTLIKDIKSNNIRFLAANMDYINLCRLLKQPQKGYEHFKYVLSTDAKEVIKGMIYITIIECLIENYTVSYLDLINELIAKYEQLAEQGLFAKEMEYEPSFIIGRCKEKLAKVLN